MNNSKYRAVIFDLFGTLIPNFSETEYKQIVLQIAEFVKAPPEEFWNLYKATFKESILGILPSPEAKIEYVCHKLGIFPPSSTITKAAKWRYDFEAATMLPRPGSVEVLAGLKSRGLKIGLISDCSSEAPGEWNNTALAPWFDVTVFSCLVGVKKPDQRIYQIALDKLGVAANDCLYIGDGSSNELSGATAVGMNAIQLKVPGEDHADVYRIDFEDWKGKSVTALNDLLGLV